MKAYYPLKQSQPANLVEPLIQYIQLNISHDRANQFRPLLSKINELRNKATTLDLSNANPDTIKKYIAVLEMYVKFALLIAKHFNWNTEYGNTVQGLKLVWSDSFNPSVTFTKGQIHYDIFCCFYNLGILHFLNAVSLCMEDLPSARKQSMTAAKNAFYYFNRNRTYYYKGFMNTGFSDTDYGHLETLQYTCLGIVYKNFFNNFKEDQYKIGINKIAALAGLAKQHFYNAYQVGTAYFMKASYISNNIKSELLSFIYVQSLYHDVICNTKYAKHYENEMDFDKSNIVYLIAYQKRALRLLNLGISNQSVSHLLDQRAEQKKQLYKIKPQLQASITKNVNRNEQIYKKQEIPQDKIPAPPEPPKQYLLKPKQPQGIVLSYDGTMTAPFAKLIDNESKGFMTQLRQYANNRISGLQSAYSKLRKNIQQRFNDGYVNYYLNLDQQQQKGVPQNIKRKIQQIRSNGGGQKLQIQAKIIKTNSQQVAGRFQQLRNMIMQEASFDDQKRNQFGNSWKRPPSIVANKSYVTQLETYQNKAKQADAVNYKLLDKYHSLQKYILVIDKDDNAIMSVLPKVQLNQFISQNKKDFDQLKSGYNETKQKQTALEVLLQDIIKFYNKMDFEKEANTFYKELNEGNRQEILAKIFATGKQHIESFNSQAKTLDDLSQKVAELSRNLNSKNKSDDYSKKQFETVMSHFNAISNLFQQLSQGTTFYTKLNDILVKIGNDLEGFIEARRMEAVQLEKSLKRGGNHGTPNLPSMYPNQQPAQMIPNNNFGFYIPPPTFGNSYMGGPTGFQQHSNDNVSDMLSDMMKSRPDFNTDVFGGNVYVSKVKRF